MTTMAIMDAITRFLSYLNPLLWAFVAGMTSIVAMNAFHAERFRRKHSKLCPKCAEKCAKHKWWIGAWCRDCMRLSIKGLQDQHLQIAAMARQRMVMARINGSNDGGDPADAARHEAMGQHGRTFEVSKDRKSIKCLVCNMTSHNRDDVRNKYCGSCHKSHEEIPGL